jgi:hypothetical protein
MEGFHQICRVVVTPNININININIIHTSTREGDFQHTLYTVFRGTNWQKKEPNPRF